MYKSAIINRLVMLMRRKMMKVMMMTMRVDRVGVMTVYWKRWHRLRPVRK